MPRRPRRSQHRDGACYHVMSRGHNREVVFADQADFEKFLGLLAEAQERFPMQLYHYCLMSNHFHLLVDCAKPKDL